MNAPWYDPNLYGWLPGTLFGVLVGAWGSLVGVMAPRGRGRGAVLGTGVLFAVAAAGFLVAAVVAAATGQPYGVWYGLGLPGVLGLALVPALLFNVRRAYAEAERRRVAARDVPL